MNASKILLVLLLLACVSLVGCSRKAYEKGYKEGRQEGYDEGYKVGKASGFNRGKAAAGTDYDTGYYKGKAEGYREGKAEGYRNGYAAGRPGAGVPLSGVWRVVFVLASLVGVVAVLGSLVWLMNILINASRYPRETWGKRLAAGLAGFILFTLNTGFTSGSDAPGLIREIALLPAATGLGKLCVIALVALATYGFFSLLLRLPGWSRGVWLQAMMVFLLALTAGLLGGALRPLIFTPRLETYLISHVVCGVVIGGMAFVMRHMIEPARHVDYSFFPYFASLRSHGDDGVFEPEWQTVGASNGKEP
jgi:hypothetical protein